VPRGSGIPPVSITVRLPLWFGCHRRIGKECETEALCLKRKPDVERRRILI
jgi:hypothetical protein